MTTNDTDELRNKLVSLSDGVYVPYDTKDYTGVKISAEINELINLFAAQNNATYEAVMKAIGENEHEYYCQGCDKSVEEGRNKFRAELRQSINKIFGKESE